MIKGKQPEEIRKLFNIQNDFTPEEEAQIRRENVRWLHFLYILYKAHTYRNGPKIASVHRGKGAPQRRRRRSRRGQCRLSVVELCV